ncbi:site-specific integrase [Micromonospora chersina]|uniref:site-specific integrase n=1 Tax=Micromonospora chersina TaxID=47854 RepID=UPI003C8D7ED6
MPGRRRANGEGTIVRRTDGRFHAAYYVLDPEGNRRRRFVYGRTWEECHSKLVEMKSKTAQGVPLAVKAWTLERYLHHWLTEVVGRRLRATTLAGYEIVIRVHLVPALGKKHLTKLTPQDVRKLLTAKRQAGLWVRMVQYIHAVLRNALQNAVREELVARNVARLVQVETPDYEVGQGLTILQAQRLLETVRPTRWYSLYVLALMLGLRRGELLGLRWSDVDLDRKTLTVRQNLVRASGELRVQAPKTRRSRRTLPLPPPVVAALRRQQEVQARERSAAGSSWARNDLMFTTSLGTPIEPRNLTRHFYSVRDRAGLPGIRFHDLRHTCLTLLLSLGTPPHIAQAIAGHSHVDVTMMIYAHSGMAEQTEALRKLGEAFNPSD